MYRKRWRQPPLLSRDANSQEGDYFISASRSCCLQISSFWVNTTSSRGIKQLAPLLTLKTNWFYTLTVKQYHTSLFIIISHCLLRPMRKHLMSSCYITGVSQGFPLVLFFFCFPMKVTGDHIHNCQEQVETSCWQTTIILGQPSEMCDQIKGQI